MISRRDALKLGAAGMTLTAMMSRLQSAVALQNDPGVWNWKGNAGHTGEMAGPGIDFSKPLGEKWRIPKAWDMRLSGYLNDTLFITRTFEESGRLRPAWRIEAWSVMDGSMLWSRNAPGYESHETFDQEASTPEAPVDGLTFKTMIAVYQDSVILPLSNGNLWSLDVKTGEDQWTFDSIHNWIDLPTISNNTAFFLHDSGICALELGAAPTVRWDIELNDSYNRFLGVDDRFVWVGGSASITAIDIESGNEYWKLPSDILWDNEYAQWWGISQGNSLFQNAIIDELTAIDDEGTIVWSKDDSEYNDNRKVIVNDSISRFTPSSSNWDSCRIQCLSIADGAPLWDFDLFTDRWQNNDRSAVICGGVAYYALYDTSEDHEVLLAIDPIAKSIRCVRGSTLNPEIVSAGVLFAIDFDTEEIVCIGSVPGTLHADGQAKVTQTTSMYGAPNTSSADRGQVTEGMQLTVTGDAETTPEGDWFPVTLNETGTSGWLLAKSMEGLDGDIVFDSIDISEFGVLTSYQN